MTSTSGRFHLKRWPSAPTSSWRSAHSATPSTSCATSRAGSVGALRSATRRSRSRAATHAARFITVRASTTTRTNTSFWSAHRLRRQRLLLLEDPLRKGDSRRIRRVHAAIAQPPRAQSAGLRVRRVGGVEDDSQIETKLRHVPARAQWITVRLRELVTGVEVGACLHLHDACYEITQPDRYPLGESVNMAKLGFDLGVVFYASDTPYTQARTLGARGLSYRGMDSTYAAAIALARRILQQEETLPAQSMS